MKRISLVFLALILSSTLISQSAEITIDGKFDDWNPSLTTYTDLPDSPSGIDLIECQVTNDENFLYFHLLIDTEVSLIETIVPHDIRLYLDTDNDAGTGFIAQTGVGSELGIVFKDRFAYYNVTPFSSLDLEDFQLRKETTYNGVEFEFAIARDAIPDGTNPLFPENTIRILFVDDCAGCDDMPDVGIPLLYTFDDTPITPYTPILLEKTNSDYIRAIAYNTEESLDDPGSQDEFERIFQALDPDILGFSEASVISAVEVKTLMDSWLPLGTVDGWYTIKDDWNLITASKWPILSSWSGMDRHFANLIDLPSSYSTDLLFVLGHLKCCSNGDVDRQAQVDEFASFILDAKSPGGSITLVDNTPFMFCGDMNMVGDQQQYQTVITGDIQDTGTWGSGAPLDWDDSDLSDICPIQSDQRMAYTWRDDISSYPPGRLDYFFCSDAVMTVPKSFVLQTEIMSPARLATYGLNQNDTQNASDHFPIIMDISLIILVDDDSDGVNDDIDNCLGLFNPNQEDWNSNGIGDHCEDSDSDGLLDYDEIYVFGTNPDELDTDSDMLNDGVEILDFGTDPLLMDSDGDGLTDGLEVSYNITDPNLFDSDGDGCDDASFFHYLCPGQSVCVDPCPVDTNADGVINILDMVNISSSFGNSCD